MIQILVKIILVLHSCQTENILNIKGEYSLLSDYKISAS